MSGIVFQFSIIIGGVITILIGLVLSDIILQSVAGASTYGTTVGQNAQLGPATPSDVYSSCNLAENHPAATGNPPRLSPGNVPSQAGDPVTAQHLGHASTTRASCNLSSFMGSEAVLFLLPIVYYLFIIAIGLGMIGAGSLGVMGRGPTGGMGAR